MESFKKRNERGFTIVELLIVITATGFITAALLSFTFYYWRHSYALQADLDTLVSRLNAGDSLREQLSSATGMIMQTSIQDDNVLAPDPSDSRYWVEINAEPGTIAAGESEVLPLAYFTRFSFDQNRQIIFNNSTPYEDEYVLYINGPDRTLRLRTIANPNAPDNHLKTSCPDNLATAGCPADRVVAEDIASIGSRYFSRTGNVIDYTAVTDDVTGDFIGPNYTAAEVAEIELNITKRAPFQADETTIVSTIIRVALRN